MSVTLLSAPAVEPVTLAEGKAWLRLTYTDDDAIVAALLVAARASLEAITQRAFITQSWRIAYDSVPQSGMLTLPILPVLAINAIGTVSNAGAVTPIPASAYGLDLASEPVRIAFTSPPVLSRALSGLQVDVTAGYGPTPGAVPEPLRLAIRMLTAYWYEHRGADLTDGNLVPADVLAIIAPFRRRRLA